jgi:hypothetical protein
MANKRISELQVGSLNEQSIIPITRKVTSKPLLVAMWHYLAFFLVVVLLAERHALLIV